MFNLCRTYSIAEMEMVPVPLAIAALDAIEMSIRIAHGYLVGAGS